MPTDTHTRSWPAELDALAQRYYLPIHTELHIISKDPSGAAGDGEPDFATRLGREVDEVFNSRYVPMTQRTTMQPLNTQGSKLQSVGTVYVHSPTTTTPTSTSRSPIGSAVAPPGLPSKYVLEKAADLPVLDKDGQQLPFKHLYWAEPGQVRRVMVLFIRHFFCGNCQEFLRTFIAEIPPSSLPPDTSVVVIGCGAPSLIPSYLEETSCPYPIYADPDKRLYNMLGMQRSLSLGSKGPEYIQHTLVAGMMKSVIQGVKRIGAGDVTKAGDLRQNGGEYLFEVEGIELEKEKEKKTKGNAGVKRVKVTFCHRMLNTRDHTEISELAKVLQINGDNVAKQQRPKPERRFTSSGSLRGLARSLSNRRQSWLERRNSSGLTQTKQRGSRGRSRSDETLDAKARIDKLILSWRK